MTERKLECAVIPNCELQQCFGPHARTLEHFNFRLHTHVQICQNLTARAPARFACMKDFWNFFAILTFLRVLMAKVYK